MGRWRAGRSKRWTVGAVLLSILSALPLSAQCPDGSPPPCRKQSRTPSAPPARSVAVLYFQSLSPDTNDAYLADGLTEELIDRLGRIARLVVRSRQAVLRFRGRTADDPASLGRDLNATYLVTGRVRRAGGHLRVAAELLQASTGTHLWGDRYDYNDTDIFSLEADVARDVASAIAGRLLSAERAAVVTRPPLTIEAHILYLRGRYEFTRGTPAALRRAADYFKRAIGADSMYAAAWAGLADALNFLATYEAPRGLALDMKRAATQAVRLDPSSAEAHTTLGSIQLWFDWDLPAAEASFRLAQSLNPNCGPAYAWYSWVPLTLGHSEEAIAAVRRAQEINPLDFETWAWLSLWSVGRLEVVIQETRSALSMDSTNLGAHFFLGSALVQSGQPQEGLGHLRRAVALDSTNPVLLANLGHWTARMGMTEEAHDIIRLLSEKAENQWVGPVFFAAVHAGLGQADSTFAWLERGYQDREDFMLSLPWHPWWDPIRPDPRFNALLRRMRLMS